MLKRTIASFVAIATLSSPAIGAQFGTPGESGFYGGLGLGRSKTDVNAGAVSGDDTTNAWKGFAGYQFNRYFAVEGGYLDLGRASATGPAGAVSTDSTAWQASLVGSLPLSQQFAFTGKLGVARTDTDMSGIVGGAPLATSDRTTEPAYGLGLRYDFTKAFGVRGEWERLRAGGGAFGKSDVDLFTVNGIYRFF
jgi:OOP family OmpA-OmpF porin